MERPDVLFIYTQMRDKAAGKAKPNATLKLTAELKTAVMAAAQEDGWAFLGAVGSYLNKNDPAFDSRNYGYKKLRDLVHAQSCLEIDERRADPESPISQIYVRLKAT